MNRIAEILAVILVLLAFPANAEPSLTQSVLEIKTQAGKSHFFTIELAETKEQQSQGLMFRTTLDEDKGMLFLFKHQPQVAMWMKNTLISLDMLFISKAGEIIYIAQNTKPESTDAISAYMPTAAVLELAGGVTEKLGITVGDTAKHHYFEN